MKLSGTSDMVSNHHGFFVPKVIALPYKKNEKQIVYVMNSVYTQIFFIIVLYCVVALFVNMIVEFLPHTSLDHRNYFQTSKGHMTWII